MEKLFLDMNTKYLTNHGMKYINEIDNEDSLLIINKANRIIECNNFSIEYSEFSTGYDNFDSNYSRCITNIPINTDNCVHIINTAKSEKSEFYVGNIEQDIWYKDISYDISLLLSIFVTDYFTNTFEEDMLIRKSNITNMQSVRIFKEFNKRFGFYFPYNTINKSYNFRTSLYRNYDELIQELINNLYIFKNITKDIVEFKLHKGNNYKALLFTNYSLANLVQIMFNLNGCYTRMVREKDLFKITIVKSNEADFLHRKRHNVVKYTNSVDMASIVLNKIEGRLITSQEIDGITTISIINANNSYNIQGDD